MNRCVSWMMMMLALGLAAAADESQPPTWKGLQCIGWSKPQDQAVADGDSPGEELVVNTPLTASEKYRLRLARKAADATYRAVDGIQKEIIKSHGYTTGGSTGSMGPCGEFIMIRLDEYHITQFVPSNPSYPGPNSFFRMQSSKPPSECQAYFAKLRTKAVAATYGKNSGEE